MEKKDLKTLESYLEVYKLNCGFIKEEDIRKIVDCYGFDVSDKDLKKILDKLFYYKDGYYTSEESIVNSDFIEVRGSLPIRLLSEDEIFDFSLKESNIVNSINDIVDNIDIADEIIYVESIFKAFTIVCDESEIVMKKFEINRDQFDKIGKVFNDNLDTVRYCLYYGRTEDEYELELLLDEYVMEDKPQERTLRECINLLDDDCIKDIYDCYCVDEGNEDDLIESIVYSFEKVVHEFSKNLYDSLINEEFSYAISDDEFCSGFVFVYMEDGIRKLCVPIEIMEILKSVNREDLVDDSTLNKFGNFFKDMLDSNDEMAIDDYLMGYITMNGAMEKELLRNLLRDKHDIDISIEDMDDILKEYDVSISDEFYSIMVDDEDIQKLLDLKKNSDDYKTITKDIRDIELNFFKDIEDFGNDNWSNNEDKNDVIKGFIWHILKFGMYNKDMLDILSEEISLNKKELRLIDEFCKKYKNIVAIWSLNGYTLDDKRQVKKEKIGRNDPCPCGSGKKYKKCCGR